MIHFIELNKIFPQVRKITEFVTLGLKKFDFGEVVIYDTVEQELPYLNHVIFNEGPRDSHIG